MNVLTLNCPDCNKQNRIPINRIDDNPCCGVCKGELLNGKPIEGTSDNLDAILTSKKLIVLDFWAPWCSPCQSFTPIFQQAAKINAKKAIFIKVNTQEQQQLSAKYAIRSIPTILAFKDGKIAKSINGALPASDFNLWLDQIN